MEAPNRYSELDEAMLPFNEFASEMSNFDGEVMDELAGVKMQLSQVNLELPILLDVVVDEQGKVVLGASPPLYYEATGVESIFHNLKITVTIEDAVPR